jgi:hypothetical protein
MAKIIRREFATVIISGCFALGFFAAFAANPTALPQPVAVLYGAVVRGPTKETVIPTTAYWTISGNNESITAQDTTVVTIGSEVFYLTRIPFETRQIAGGPTFPATPDVLELTQTNTTYTRSAVVETGSVPRPATLPSGKETFIYGAARQGLIERLDLVLAETFVEWSKRVFGGPVDPAADADGDGRTNYDEFLQGTDPLSGNSLSILRSFAPAAGGGFTITWDSVVGRTYTVEWSEGLDAPEWQRVEPPMAGTGAPLSYTHPAGGGPRQFFRIAVAEATP